MQCQFLFRSICAIALATDAPFDRTNDVRVGWIG